MPDLQLATPPRFDTVEEIRQHRKLRLTAALRLFGLLGFEEGVAGHITARDPELTDHFWVNPLGPSFRYLRVSDLVLVDTEGRVVEGRYHVNRSAFAIHAAVHEARPEVVAAAHSHAVHTRALSATDQLLEPLTQDACAFYEDHAVYEEFGGVVDDPDEGKRIAAALGECKAVILRNHGLLTVGRSVDSAAWWFVTMERSAQVQLLAKAAGTVRRIPPEQARHTREQLGNEFAGWFNYQPLHERAARSEPDLAG